MKLGPKGLSLVLTLAFFNLGCATTSSQPPSKKTAQKTSKLKQSVDRVEDYSFGQKSDYDSHLYSEGRKNRYSVSFE